jgi:hypothetical protein
MSVTAQASANDCKAGVARSLAWPPQRKAAMIHARTEDGDAPVTWT